MRDLSEFTKDFYAFMRDSMVQFCAGLDDRCIKAHIGSFSRLMLPTLGNQMKEMMRTVLFNYASQFALELEILKYQCTGKINIMEDAAACLEPFVVPAVNEIWEPFKKQVQDNQEYRKKERKKIEERFDIRRDAVKKWIEEKSVKVESKSIATVLQELSEEYLHKKNNFEFSPEYASEVINKAVCDMEKISNFTQRHYTEIAKLQIQFNMDYDDLCIEAGLPSLSYEKLPVLEETMYIMMRDALRYCSRYFGDEMDYIRSRCNTNIDLKNAFFSRIQPFVLPTLSQTWNPVLRKKADHTRYRNEEKEEVLDNRYKDHKEKIEKWIEELKEKRMENSMMREADQIFIDNILHEEKSKEEHAKMIKDSYHRLELFRVSIFTAAEKSLLVYRDIYKELVGMCVKWQIHDSSQLLAELTKGLGDALKAYELCAFGILEKICGRVSLELTLADADYWSIRGEVSTQNMAPILVDAFNKLREAYGFTINDLASYGTAQRAEIDGQFKQLKIASEQFSIRNLDRKCPTIDLSPFEREQIGRGGEATVFKCNLPGSLFGKLQDMVTVVCKKFECSDISKGTDEVLTLSKLNHPNVVEFMGRGIVDNQRYLLLEYCPRSLAKCIETCRSDGSFIKADDFVKWATELAGALAFIHGHGHVHGDVKPDNILIGGDNNLKLADFGISPPVHSYSMELLMRLKCSKGTPQYMSPEQFSGKEFYLGERSKCDVWAYGICLWEMMSLQTPYGHVTEPAALMQFIGKNKEHPPIPGGSNCECLENLLRMCWVSSVKGRLPMYVIEQRLPELREEIKQESAQDPEGYWPGECAKWAEVGRRWAEAEPSSAYGYSFLHFAHPPASGNDDSDSKE